MRAPESTGCSDPEIDHLPKRRPVIARCRRHKSQAWHHILRDTVSRQHSFYGNNGDWGLGFHLQPTTDDPNGPHNFGWRGIGGTLFVVDPENDFYLLYMEQRRGGPQGAPFSANVAQRVVYDAMRD